MDKEFVPYEIALELKELGFYDYRALMIYRNEKLFPLLVQSQLEKLSNTIKAPLYQQAFRWFREKHDIHSFTDLKWKKNGWDFEMVDMNKMETISSLGKYGFESQEKAEIACLKKLIEIIKEK